MTTVTEEQRMQWRAAAEISHMSPWMPVGYVDSQNRIITLCDALEAAEAKCREQEKEIERLRRGAAKSNEEVCQVLGKALGYPWFKDDPGNFPDATEADGVCVGDHVAESLAAEAAQQLAAANERIERAKILIGAVNDTLPEHLREVNHNRAWHILNGTEAEHYKAKETSHD